VYIWLLEREDQTYDEATGFVIVTVSEMNARDIAASQAGAEGANAWYRPDVKCTVLGEAAEGSVAGVALRSEP
jgi:hypothetical protein